MNTKSLSGDGQTRDIAAWNRDHDLITAMKYSVVPVYQEFARQIGEARMSKNAARLRLWQ
ncbi:penicillin-binding transpeptidase domain-containing protein [Klebsiella pneumoniae]|uniref:penicillin-binding transpeptidase domain-containing protein n=1 Tax=Klebsiella pneumoniae TaxID=573 RepID=UPI003A5CDD6B